MDMREWQENQKLVRLRACEESVKRVIEELQKPLPYGGQSFRPYYNTPMDWGGWAGFVTSGL